MSGALSWTVLLCLLPRPCLSVSAANRSTRPSFPNPLQLGRIQEDGCGTLFNRDYFLTSDFQLNLRITMFSFLVDSQPILMIHIIGKRNCYIFKSSPSRNRWCCWQNDHLPICPCYLCLLQSSYSRLRILLPTKKMYLWRKSP